jgi:hypothetical protein
MADQEQQEQQQQQQQQHGPPAPAAQLPGGGSVQQMMEQNALTLQQLQAANYYAGMPLESPLFLPIMPVRG